MLGNRSKKYNHACKATTVVTYTLNMEQLCGFYCDEIIRIACRFKNLRQVLESLTWNKRFRNSVPWHPKCFNRMSKNDPQTLLF
ncbi:hypothetical protein TNCT_606471 [Trichonephila clavata]|uniref:Uncharacterized protein n=1 Tax=Trichonephila clavata TaxID=2740835 RepID=A0A8X6EXV3_TRICU|nr:hypothetical protein TNCT_606471 [Trichonephila clavata]